MSFTLTPSNPQVKQGHLNRIAQSIVVQQFPSLLITGSFLGRRGIRWDPEGKAVDRIPTMTGAVNSPQPYQMVTVTANLLKSQNLALLWRAQMELLAVIGPVLVTTDATNFLPYQLVDASIITAPPLDFAGTDADYNVVIEGTYYINSQLFTGA
jgi:hypothetical protein